MPLRSILPADQLVTSSELVRHFGLWQERAARAPVYILHRGRPRFVMTSIETMDALCAPHDVPPAPPQATPEQTIDTAALLDGIGDPVLLATREGIILSSSRSARAHFGALAAPGEAIEHIAPPATREFLADTIRRVIASGIADWVEIPSAARPGRTLALTVEAAAHGIILFGRDSTAEEESRTARAAARALEAAMAAAGGVAVATINPRGYLAVQNETLAHLTGLSREALTMIRFVTLVEIGARVGVGEAIEGAMSGATPPPLDAHLLVNRADPLAVRLGFAPLRGGTMIDGVVAVIAARA